MQTISESLKRQREQILSDGSEDVLSRHTSLLEIAVISLYNRLANNLNVDPEQFRAGGAILALGDFARGMLGPEQPVPILILKAESSPWKDHWLSEIISPLADAGWIVDAEQSTIDELLDRARDDFPFLIQLVDVRYISGNRQLAEQLDKAVENLIEGRQGELLDRLYEKSVLRKTQWGNPENWLEPDLQRNPGGLADIATLRAACRVAGGIRSFEDAIFQGYLNREEVDFLQQAEKFYTRLLGLLRSFSPERTTLLHFDDQEFLAEKLGYSARSGFLPVETFIQRLYQLFHGVAGISSEFWERLQESRYCLKDIEDGPEALLEEGVAVQCGKIYVYTDRYSPSAGNVVHLFALAAKHGMGFSNVTRQWIRHHRNVLDTAAGDPSVKAELLETIRLDAPELPVLRRFYGQGLLTSLIPELAAVHGLAQHDAFHLYPVHEHHLRTLTGLKQLLAGDYEQSEPELTRIARNIEDPVWLFLSGLLHDIGKSSGSGHAQHGREMIPTIAKRLGLTEEQSELVQFLVAQHLLLMDSASLRDLADESMLTHCAQLIGTSGHLDMLALLSFADMAATGPRGLQKWRDTPTMQLYGILRHLLEKGEPSPRAIAERIDQMRAQLAKEVSDLMDSEQLDSYFAQLAPRYLLSMTPGDVARHLRLEYSLRRSGESYVVEVEESDGMAAITVVSWQMPGLLFRVAGILTLHEMNIMGAQVFTMENGMGLLIFQCRLPEEARRRVDWDEVRSDMKRLLLGKLALDYRIAAHAAGRAQPQAVPRTSASEILFDNESSGNYTILEVYTLDRVGLLYIISRTLFELQIRIYVAKITTKVDQVADAFYIRTNSGEKVTDPEQMNEIKRALHFWLDHPSVSQG